MTISIHKHYIIDKGVYKYEIENNAIAGEQNNNCIHGIVYCVYVLCEVWCVQSHADTITHKEDWMPRFLLVQVLLFIMKGFSASCSVVLQNICYAYCCTNCMYVCNKHA